MILHNEHVIAYYRHRIEWAWQYWFNDPLSKEASENYKRLVERGRLEAQRHRLIATN